MARGVEEVPAVGRVYVEEDAYEVDNENDA